MARKIQIDTDVSKLGKIDDQFARETIKQELESYKNKRVRITIEDARGRSNEQLRYLRGVIYPLIIKYYEKEGDMTMTNETLHSDFCRCYLAEVETVNFITGEVYKKQKTTSDLSMSEMAMFIQSVIDWVQSNLGLKVPEPEAKTEKKTDLKTVLTVF